MKQVSRPRRASRGVVCTATEPILITVAEGREVVIEPADEDRFVMTSIAVAQACDRHKQAERFHDEIFLPMLKHLGNWLIARSERVASARLDLCNEEVRLYLFAKPPCRSWELTAEGASLSISLVKEFSVPIFVLSLPGRREQSLPTIAHSLVFVGLSSVRSKS